MKRTSLLFFCFIVLILAFPIIARAGQEDSEQGKKETTQPSELLEIRAFAERNVFVADEPTAITYIILFKVGVSFDENTFHDLDIAPFKVISVSAGNRTAVPEIKDMEMQKFKVFVSLKAGASGSVFMVPPVKIDYGFDEIAPDKDGKMAKNRRGKKAFSNRIKLEKVLIYAETNMLHEVMHIGDIGVIGITVHAGKEVELLNEFPPEKAKAGIKYLSAFSLERPFALLDIQRESGISEQYKIIKYSYIFSVLDIQPKPYLVSFPPVLWQEKNKKRPEVKAIIPEPALVEVRSILKKDTPFEPQKSVRADFAKERMLFFLFPFIAMVLILANLLAWLFWELVKFLRFRKIRRQAKPQLIEEKLSDLKVVFETSLWARFRLKLALNRTLVDYNNHPDEKNCVRLRNLLARYIVSGLKGNNRISCLAACSMTAAELEEKTGPEMKNFLSLLRAADKCLETTAYEFIGRKE